MNLQLQDSQKVAYAITAFDAAGLATNLNPGDTLAVASSDETLATVVPDATPVPGSVASGFILAQPKIGTVQVSAAVTKADGSAGPTGQVSIDIVAGAEATIGMTLGTPVSQ